MKLAKTLALSAIVAGSFAATSAMAASGFYGHMHVTLQSTSSGGGNDGDSSQLQLVDGGSSPSRFGFTGSTTNDGTTFGVRIEAGYNFAREVGEGRDGTFRVRQGYASIAGDWGQVVVGQSETAIAGLEESYWARTWIADGPGRADSPSQFGFFFGAYRDHVIRYDSPKLADVISFHVSVGPERGNPDEDGVRAHQIGLSARANGDSWTANGAFVTAGEAQQAAAGGATTANITVGGVSNVVQLGDVAGGVSVGAESIILVNGAYDFGPILLDAAFSQRTFGANTSGADSETEANLYFRVEFQTSRTAYGAYFSQRTNASGVEDSNFSAFGAQVRYDIKSANAQTYAYFRSDSAEVASGNDPDSVTTIGLGVRVQFGVDFQEGTLSVM